MVLTMSKSSNLKFIILCWVCPSEKKILYKHFDNFDIVLQTNPEWLRSLFALSEYSFVESGARLSYECSPSDVSRVMYPFLCLRARSVDISIWWVFHSVFLPPSREIIALKTALRDLRNRVKINFLVRDQKLFSSFFGHISSVTWIVPCSSQYLEIE